MIKKYWWLFALIGLWLFKIKQTNTSNSPTYVPPQAGSNGFTSVL